MDATGAVSDQIQRFFSYSFGILTFTGVAFEKPNIASDSQGPWEWSRWVTYRTQDAGSNRTTTSTSFNERQSLCREEGGPWCMM